MKAIFINNQKMYPRSHDCARNNFSRSYVRKLEKLHINIPFYFNLHGTLRWNNYIGEYYGFIAPRVLN